MMGFMGIDRSNIMGIHNVYIIIYIHINVYIYRIIYIYKCRISSIWIYINVELVVYGGFLVLIFYTVYLVMYGNGMIKLGDPQNQRFQYQVRVYLDDFRVPPILGNLHM